MGYDPEEIARLFGRTAPTYDSVIPFFAQFGERLVNLADLRPGERVLDVASGRGATLFPAAAGVAPNGEVLGVDLSEEMVARLTDEVGRRAPNATVRRMDVEALEVDDGSFDVAIAAFVLHLLSEPARGAACLAAALRPGGRCVASVPSLSGRGWEFLGPLFVSFVRRATRPMAVPFRADFDLAGLLASAGFDVTHVADEEIDFSFADEQAWWTWAWSGGMRAVFEILEPHDLEDLRGQLFAELAARRTADGIPMNQKVRFAVGVR